MCVYDIAMNQNGTKTDTQRAEPTYKKKKITRNGGKKSHVICVHNGSKICHLFFRLSKGRGRNKSNNRSTSRALTIDNGEKRGGGRNPLT